MVKSGMHYKGGINAVSRKPKQITISIRLWDTQLELIQQAVLVTEIPQPEYVLHAALVQAAKDLKIPLPEFPEIKRKPTPGTTPIERAAKAQGVSVTEFSKLAAAAMAEQVLRLATDSKATGTGRR